MKQTALTSIDSYKLAHLVMWPEETNMAYANFTPRSNHHFNVPKEYKKDGLAVWFGLQAFLHEMVEIWDTTFFSVPKNKVISEFAELVAPFCGDQGLDTSKLEELHDYGRLPLLIRALPEGTLVPMGVPVLTIERTDARFYWLAAFMETWLSMELWKASTSATTARVYRKIMEKYTTITGGNKDFVAVSCHDFSPRGMSGYADAAKSGAGHLLSFIGTDNLPAVKFVKDYYRGKETFVGCSVPASEHGVMSAGTKDSELDTYRRMLKLYPTGIVSLVSDTYDFFNVITNFAVTLKDEIMARQPDSLGLCKVVFRPDSGDPADILCGEDIPVLRIPMESWGDTEVIGEWAADAIVSRVFTETPHGEDGESNPVSIFKVGEKYFEVGIEIEWNRYDKQYYYIADHSVTFVKEVTLTSQQKGAVQCLWDIFGGTTNERGYKTLDPHVGLIYGDSITPERCEDILCRLFKKGFASDNVVYGIGSFSFTFVSRDTLGFAMKTTYISGKDGGVEIFKDPVTDNVTKKSAKGLLMVTKENGKYVLTDQVTYQETNTGYLQPVFSDGKILVDCSFEEIRNRLVNANKEAEIYSNK